MAEMAVDDGHRIAEPSDLLPQTSSSFWKGALKVLKPLASLKLTVALLVMAIFIVFTGTLAQVQKDVWEAINHYFRTPIAWIDFQIFFPASFFPSRPIVPGGFYFPGGWLIGLLMVINLLAAHGLRFKVQASGNRLVTGLLVIAVGAVTTWLVIASGSNPDGMQQETWVDIEWTTLWNLLKLGITALGLVSGYGWAKLLRRPKMEPWATTVAGLGLLLLSGLAAWLWYEGDAVRLNDSGMRILWQLIKGTFAGLVLLAGCVMVFRKRAGVVLLHAGVLLMMFNELLVGTTAKEGQMIIAEGQTVQFVQDSRQVELALIDRSDPEHDDVVVIPQSMLRPDKPIDHQFLPCDVEVIRYLKNSGLRSAKPGEDNPADAGAGLNEVAVGVTPGAGTDAGGKVDSASAYVKFTGKDGTHIGTYLLSQFLVDQPITVDGTSYDVSLRFKRTYKPYSISLIEVRKDDYLGTNTPRNYSSDVRLVDDTRNVDRQVRIWMNNPLRFGGDTLYQSNYNVDPQTGVKSTGLQVVSNTGWMIPYVACMIVATGMLAHFSIVLVRFLKRRSEEQVQRVQTSQPMKTGRSKKVEQNLEQQEGWPELAARYIPLVVVAIFAVWLAGKAQPPDKSDDGMKLYEFGKLPLVEQGRVKPFDTLARNSLRIISDRQTFEDNGKTQPAIRWLLDVIARPGIAEKHRVFRIESPEVLETLDLERREGLRYSVSELRPKLDEYNRQVDQAHKVEKKDPKDLTLYQRKILELDRRVRTYTLLQASFHAQPFPPFPTEEELNTDRENVMKRLVRIKELLEEAEWLNERLTSMHAPLSVPAEGTKDEQGENTWQAYATAVSHAYRGTIRGEDPNPATVALTAIFDAYATGDAVTFNSEVARYQGSLAANPPLTEAASAATLNLPKAKFEAFFNHFEPFFHASMLYLIGFIIACLAWLGWFRPLNRISSYLIALSLVVHTFALISRIYISGRPPVTNLYSAAVFIGFGAVVLGLVLEAIYRMGIGNVIAGVAGFMTLLIAHLLAADGDTFTVLQAVLDTQFWLATHVVCITLGYATTFVAGLLGVLYVVVGVLTPSLSPNLAKASARMIYGILCFAIFFSFVGTVLGGLWADDSWGRFWGWDPKENGALIIVLWNALILHARWDGMVKDRGLALLAIAGNITTGWSMFGVNELGVGLHSYGFTEGVLRALGLFVISQLALIALGSMPRERWWSFRRHGSNPAEA